MGNNLNNVAKKLQTAIEQRFGVVLVFSKQEWYSTTTCTRLSDNIIRRAEIGENGKPQYSEIFRSVSKIQQCLFLRDYWYWLNGWQLPTDNVVWNEKRKRYYSNEMYKELQEAENERRTGKDETKEA